jgi:hypothetical protein
VGWKKPSALTRRSEASRRYRSTRSCRLSIGGTYCRSPRRSSCNVLWQGIAPLLSGAPVGGRSGIVEIGRKLVEVKERVDYQGFVAFVTGRLKWSERTASRFIDVFKMFATGNLPVDTLTIDASSLYLIAAPSTPEEARQAVQGGDPGRDLAS